MTDLALTQDRLELVRRTIAPDLTDAELELFGATCRRLGLDPLARQIHAVKRSGRMTIQAGIDGLRLVAQRTGDYAGQEGPHWCGPDGQWRDVWLEKAPPAAARMGVYRRGFSSPLWAVARWDSYAVPQSPTWKKMPDVMLAKCAEALALRRAFPAELAGVYGAEEMHQADGPAETPEAVSEPPEPAQRPALPSPAVGLLEQLREVLEELQPGHWSHRRPGEIQQLVVAPKAAQRGRSVDPEFIEELLREAHERASLLRS
jgi:phage recombination protein Bet